MPQKQLSENLAPDLNPQLVQTLETVLRKIQEKVAVERSPGHTFALIHLVENLILQDWRAIAAQMVLRDWLVMPLDREGRVSMETLIQTLKTLTFQCDHDFLTGLANRRRFDRVADQELQRALRTEMPLSMVMIDIDDFKRVNDTHGHATGDKVLAALGDLLRRSMRVYDLATRFGGEEFCLLLPGTSTLQAYDLAVRLLEEFKTIRFETVDSAVFTGTFSAGVVTSRNRSGRETVEDLLAHADELLYQAKRQGKNQVCTMVAWQAVSENPALVQAAEKQFLFTGKIAL